MKTKIKSIPWSYIETLIWSILLIIIVAAPAVFAELVQEQNEQRLRMEANPADTIKTGELEVNE